MDNQELPQPHEHPERPILRHPAVFVLLALLGTAIFIRAVLFPLLSVETWLIPSESMQPTINPGDRLVTWDWGDLERGDIVILERVEDSPAAADHSVVRVVAFGGETVSFENDVLNVDGEPLEEEYLPPGTPTVKGGPSSESSVFVPADHVFVLGDNRNRSADSRFYGPVPVENIVANNHLVWWNSD